MDWPVLAIVALVLFGFSRILYIRASAQYAVPEEKFLKSLYLAGLLTMSPLIILERRELSLGNIYAGIILSMLSVAGSLAMYRAVALSSPSMVNVIVGLNFLMPLIVGLVALQEKLTYIQLLGLALALITIALSMIIDIKYSIRDEENGRATRRGIVYAFVTFFTWGMLGILVKAMYISNILNSIPQCLWAMYLSGLAVLYLIHRGVEAQGMSRLGIAAGVLSSLGSYLVTLCYAVGEISVTALITRFSYLLPAVYSLATSCEKASPLKILVIVLSVISLILLSY